MKPGDRVRWNHAGRKAYCPADEMNAKDVHWFRRYFERYSGQAGTIVSSDNLIVVMVWDSGETFAYDGRYLTLC